MEILLWWSQWWWWWWCILRSFDTCIGFFPLLAFSHSPFTLSIQLVFLWLVHSQDSVSPLFFPLSISWSLLLSLPVPSSDFLQSQVSAQSLFRELFLLLLLLCLLLPDSGFPLHVYLTRTSYISVNQDTAGKLSLSLSLSPPTPPYHWIYTPGWFLISPSYTAKPRISIEEN